MRRRPGVRQSVGWFVAAMAWFWSVSGAIAADVLNLKQAVELGLQQSAALSLARLNVEEAELNWRQVELGGASVSPQARQDAANALEQAQAGLIQSRGDVALNVEQRYYAVLQAERSLELAGRAEAKASRELEIAQARFDEGLISPLDLATAERDARAAQRGLARAEHAVARAMQSLNQAMGTGLDEVWSLDPAPPLTPPGPELDSAHGLAFEHRSDWLEAQATLAAREADVAQARNPFTPPADLQKAEIARDRAAIQLEQMRVSIMLEVDDAVLDVQDDWAEVESRRDAVRLAEDSLQIERTRFESGISSELSLEDARSSLLQAQSQLAAAEESYRITWKTFLRTLGLPIQTAASGEAAGDGAE